MTITASGILFKEWNILTAKDIVGALCGFVIIISGVFLLHAFKDVTVTLSDLLKLTNKQNGVEGGSEIGTSNHDPIVIKDSSTTIEMESLSPSSPHPKRTHRGKVLSPVITNGNVDHSDLSDQEDESSPFVQ